MSLLEIEENQSSEFYTSYLNNLRCLIKLFDHLLVKDDFIMLPGDEIVEKKHANVKILTATTESADISKRKTRKWPGLGPNVFDIDYEAQFEDYAPKQDLAPEESQPEAEAKPMEENEISVEVEVMNTDQHKAIIKGRDKYYTTYKSRFE